MFQNVILLTLHFLLLVLLVGLVLFALLNEFCLQVVGHGLSADSGAVLVLGQNFKH